MTRKADLPVDDWGASAARANGRLEVIGGAIDNGAACGTYKIGGSLGGFNPVPFAEQLPGYDRCGGDVSWLSENATGFDLAPGQTVSVRITADSSTLSQPGTNQGELIARTDSPYGTAAPIDVVLQARN
ncbi:MAG TPA: hypothetical protein VH373_23380 [Jatrophihabitantaceae bacterium]